MVENIDWGSNLKENPTANGMFMLSQEQKTMKAICDMLKNFELRIKALETKLAAVYKAAGL